MWLPVWSSGLVIIYRGPHLNLLLTAKLSQPVEIFQINNLISSSHPHQKWRLGAQGAQELQLQPPPRC